LRLIWIYAKFYRSSEFLDVLVRGVGSFSKYHTTWKFLLLVRHDKFYACPLPPVAKIDQLDWEWPKSTNWTRRGVTPRKKYFTYTSRSRNKI